MNPFDSYDLLFCMDMLYMFSDGCNDHDNGNALVVIGFAGIIATITQIN